MSSPVPVISSVWSCRLRARSRSKPIRSRPQPIQHRPKPIQNHTELSKILAESSEPIQNRTEPSKSHPNPLETRSSSWRGAGGAGLSFLIFEFPIFEGGLYRGLSFGIGPRRVQPFPDLAPQGGPRGAMPDQSQQPTQGGEEHHSSSARTPRDRQPGSAKVLAWGTRANEPERSQVAVAADQKARRLRPYNVERGRATCSVGAL